MAIEHEFLPCLNNWALVFTLIAFALYWSKINCIDPKLKEMKDRGQREALANGNKPELAEKVA